MSSPPPSGSLAPTSPPATNSAAPTAGTNQTASPPPGTNSTNASSSAGEQTSPPTPVSAASPPNGSTPAAFIPGPPKGLPPGALAGLIVGVALGAIIVLIGVGIFVLLYRRKKRKAVASPPPPGHTDDLHAGPTHYGQQSAHPTPENKVTFVPKLPHPGTGPNPARSPAFSPICPEPPSINIILDSEKPFQPPSPGMAFGFSQNTFTIEELAKATDGFSNANLLGQGSFGYVHKGVLPNGKVVAIKQLKTGSRQGEREFRAEIEIISRVHHRHLVSLVGYCITGDQRMVVYEFVPNNTLEFHLRGKGRPTMDWSTRMKIAVGSAKGLAYLHEDCHPKIIHRDIKAANILLDYSFEAKVADFGLAKLALDTDTHVSTRVMGTFGYIAPEYASTGNLTDRSDVFSFGVVLLELITGRRPVDRTQIFIHESLVDWARPLLTQSLENGNCAAVVDPKLLEYDPHEMTRMIYCAAACVRQSAWLRPPMSQIVRALEGNMSLDYLGDGLIPGYSTVYSSYASSDYDSGQYKDDLKKFKQTALGSQELGNSETVHPASEYGEQHLSSSTDPIQTTQDMENQNAEKNIRDSL